MSQLISVVGLELNPTSVSLPPYLPTHQDHPDRDLGRTGKHL